MWKHFKPRTKKQTQWYFAPFNKMGITYRNRYMYEHLKIKKHPGDHKIIRKQRKY